MRYNIEKVHEGRITDEEPHLSIVQLCRMCEQNSECIIEMVNYGIIDPTGDSVREWRFSFSSVQYVRKAIRLQNDLEVNIAGAALAIHLLKRIEELEKGIKVT